MQIVASNARATTTGVERGVDVTVALTIDGETITGTVTLIDGQRWGDLDMWMSRQLFRVVAGRRDIGEIINEIEAHAAEAVRAMEE